ncbi:hypothetical protein Q3O60_06510 [Alkalimonas collagenimarina]|uniref:PQ-loop repeat-containing protein n=1 Tax=Alkalimonas collagenimarina TaxID=400390 RepID=A0ABT9GXP4_9GAMM|nr:hypothetical protein [Alkalimonas collagenimarina]MDP4535832.1 hypothetical protein [Alkalimonas collagenimarina]
MDWISFVGIVPAVIFPTATMLQVVHLHRVKNATGVSALSWSAFAMGNLALYIYTEKYLEWQAMLGMLGTAMLQVYLIALILHYQKKSRLTST